MTSDDDFLRSQLSGGSTPGAADSALVSLKPSMRRARRRRHLAIGAMAAALVGVSGAGVVAVSSSRPAPILQTSSAPEEVSRAPESSDPTQGATSTDVATSLGAEPEESEEVEDETPASSEMPASSEASVSPSSDASVPEQQPASSSPGASLPTGPAPTTVASVVPSSRPETTTTSTEAPAGSTTSVAPVSGEETIASSCGFVTVSFFGDAVSLLSTDPASGFAVDVKNAGPQEVEVGFAGGDAECEVKARMQSGQLSYSVDNHDT